MRNERRPMDWKEALGALKMETFGESPLSEEEGKEDADFSAKDPSKEGLSEKVPSQKLNVVVEKKGRSGKTATIVEGFTLPDDEVAEIAAKLKKRLGTGGSARGGEILIQGSRRDDVIAALRALGVMRNA